MKSGKYLAMLEGFMRDAIEMARMLAIKEITDQGHVASGKLIAIDIAIDHSAGVVSGYLVMEDYAEKLDVGGFLTSGYRAMLTWAGYKHPEWTVISREQLARNTFGKRSPSRGSYAWSKNGRRKAWSKYALDRNMGLIGEKLKIEQIIDSIINDFIRA